MVRCKSVYGIFLVFILISNGYAEDKEETKEKEQTKKDEKTVSKRGIFHLGHSHVPHVHASPVISIVPKIPTIVTKIPTVIKPIVQPAVLPAPVLPTTPYHITHGGASVTTFNVNYPRVPIVTKTFIPPALPVLPGFPHHHHHSLVPHHHHGLVPHHHHHSLVPHHHHHGLVPHHHDSFLPHNHHHSVFPHIHSHDCLPHDHHHHSFFPHDHHDHFHPILPTHTHVTKTIIPVAVPAIRQPKIPTFIPSKPIFVTPQKPDLNPTFVPIPVPTNPGITSSPTNNINHNHLNIFPTTQQTPIQQLFHDHHHFHQNPQGNCQPIIMQTKPTQSSATNNYLPFNYHAALNKATSSLSNNFPTTKNFISGQGHSVSQQLALYQQQQQQILHDHQNSFPYPAAAETFSQNYDGASNDGNYHGLSSYQVPLGVH